MLHAAHASSLSSVSVPPLAHAAKNVPLRCSDYRWRLSQHLPLKHRSRNGRIARQNACRATQVATFLRSFKRPGNMFSTVPCSAPAHVKHTASTEATNTPPCPHRKDGERGRPQFGGCPEASLRSSLLNSFTYHSGYSSALSGHRPSTTARWSRKDVGNAI